MTTTTQIVPSDNGYTEGQRAVRDFVCAEDEGALVLRFVEGTWRVLCPRDATHLARISRQQIGDDDVQRRMERDPELSRTLAAQTALVPLTTQALKGLTDDQLQSRITVAFADVADATPAVRGQIMALAKLYGLDPVFDLMVYQKRPYVTYPGRLRKLREHPDYHGHKVRPLTREEKDAWGFKPDDIVVQCDADMGQHGTISDFGIVRAQNEQSPVARAHPQQLAIKRAIYRVSNQAVGIDLPTIIEQRGRVISVEREERTQPALAAGDPVAHARRRFWAIARGAAPDGLGLDDDDIHRLLRVESLTDYPGGWDQALSDLTERAAEDDVALEPGDDEARPPAPPSQQGARPPAGEPDPPAEPAGTIDEAGLSDAPETATDAALERNAELQATARELGVRGLGQFKADAAWSAQKVDKANVELSARVASRNADLDASLTAGQTQAF